MKVENVMTADVRACYTHDTLECAARLLWDRDCGSAPVIDADSRVVGVITDRDICMAAYFRGLPLREIRIGEVIRGEAFTCHPDDTIADAERSLMERRVRRLPVVDQDGRLLGIISLADIAQVAAAQRDLKKRDVVDHELADVLCAITTPRSHEESAISR